MKQFIALVFILIWFNGISQAVYPVGTIPSPKGDSAYASYGYFRPLVLNHIVIGDTMIRPRYNGAQRFWLNAGVDTAIWTWISPAWYKTTGTSGGGGGGSSTWGSITGTITNQTDLVNYISGLYVPLARTLTINGTAFDLSANRTWNVGTVTSFSSGNLSPLFTASVGTATTTPALSFALSNATAWQTFARHAGTTGAPSYGQLKAEHLNSTYTNGYTIQTDGSGNMTWVPAGGSVTPAALTKTDDANVTLTLGGTPATALLQATSLTLGWTGQLGLARGGTNADLSATGGTGQYLKQATSGAAITVGTIPASDIASGAALTKTDDTNVTLTLGGTPSTALLQSVGLTLGWTGTLAYSRFTNGAGTSVVGRAANSSGVQNDIAGTTDQVLRVNSSGTSLAFGSIDLSKTGTVGSSILAVANGGTGTSTPSLIAGTNISSITGTWPNQTINATGGSGAPIDSVYVKFNSAATAVYSKDGGTGGTGVSQAVTGNVGIGYHTLWSTNSTSASNGMANVAIGYQAMEDNTTGDANVAIGYVTMQKNTIGVRNMAFGRGALNANTTGNDNVAIGYNAILLGNGTDNVAIGSGALDANSGNSTRNIAIGAGALGSHAGANGNSIAIGYSALSGTTASRNNVVVGTSAGGNYSGLDNVAIGQSAGAAAAVSYNTALGSSAATGNTGTGNTAIGYLSAESKTSGNYNVNIGYRSGSPSNTGSNQFSLNLTNVANGMDFISDVSGASRRWAMNGTTTSLTATTPSAALDIQSTTGGLKLPTMTATQGSAISSPADGLMIYVTSTDATFTSIGFWGRLSGVWVALHL